MIPSTWAPHRRADDDRFATLACLAEEWQQASDQGLGGQDLTVVARRLEQQGGAP